MNRTDEIRSTLGRAEQVEDLTPDVDADWRASYRDHVAYLFKVISEIQGLDLYERLREQSRQLAELRRAIRTQRWVIAALAAALVFGALVGLATVRSEAASQPRFGPGPVKEMPVLVKGAGARTLGTYCTPWQVTGRHCSSGCIWERWCTDCVPGCEWYLEEECRPAPGANCPYFSPGGGGAIDTAISVNHKGPPADP